jgi:allophanate hydrolase subunit 2
MTAGARIYIAIGGGLDVPMELGSRSTYAAIGIGGVDGRALRKQDRLAVGAQAPPRGGAAVPSELQAPASGTASLRVVMGPHDSLLEPSSVSQLVESEWTATPAANRVGYRFPGPRLSFRARAAPFGAGSDPSNVVDGCYPIGALQAPAGEELIVLLNDGVTAGGYAILGTVISADRDRIAHVKPGEQVRFEAVNLDAAAAARRDRSKRLELVRTSVQRSLSG